MRRRPDKQLLFDRRLGKLLAALQEQSDELPTGLEKDALLAKVRQVEVARHTPGLRPPT